MWDTLREKKLLVSRPPRILPEFSKRWDDWILDLHMDAWPSFGNIRYTGMWKIIIANETDWHLLHSSSHRLSEVCNRVRHAEWPVIDECLKEPDCIPMQIAERMAVELRVTIYDSNVVEIGRQNP